MNSYISKLMKLDIINTNYISIGSIHIFTNIKYNNDKCLCNSKFKKSNQPKTYKSCIIRIRSDNKGRY